LGDVEGYLPFATHEEDREDVIEGLETTSNKCVGVSKRGEKPRRTQNSDDVCVIILFREFCCEKSIGIFGHQCTLNLDHCTNLATSATNEVHVNR
jgi:hypothetical protein